MVDQDGMRNWPSEGTVVWGMGPVGTGGRPCRGADPGSELMSGAGLPFPELAEVAERSGGE